MNPGAQGQYDRTVAKRERARRNFFLGLRAKDVRRWRKWERAMTRTWRCEVCRGEGSECRLPGTADTAPPDAILCHDHAADAGYCYFCGEFHAGEWDFDFRGDKLCDECRHQLRDDCPPGLFPGPRDIVLVP